jgi:hypothetical protein
VLSERDGHGATFGASCTCHARPMLVSVCVCYVVPFGLHKIEVRLVTLLMIQVDASHAWRQTFWMLGGKRFGCLAAPHVSGV